MTAKEMKAYIDGQKAADEDIQQEGLTWAREFATETQASYEEMSEHYTSAKWERAYWLGYISRLIP